MHTDLEVRIGHIAEWDIESRVSRQHHRRCSALFPAVLRRAWKLDPVYLEAFRTGLALEKVGIEFERHSIAVSLDWRAAGSHHRSHRVETLDLRVDGRRSLGYRSHTAATDHGRTAGTSFSVY